MKFPTLKQEYKDVLVFVVALLCSNFLWKWTFTGDEGGGQVVWLGIDVTACFQVVAAHIANIVYYLIGIVRHTVYMASDTTIHYLNGNGTAIAWSCTGLKQAFIWFCLLLTARGPWLKKLWYIPLGWLIAYLFNILRITLISLVIEHHPEYFELLHNYLFKYLFYGILFGLWVFWIEKIVNKSSSK